MAATANAQILRELDTIDASIVAYNNSRQDFLRELRLLFDAWVDTLGNCPPAQQAALANQLGITQAELNTIIGRLRQINGRIQTSRDFTAERNNIMDFINSYRPILAKLQNVAKPNVLGPDRAYAATMAQTPAALLSRLGFDGAPPAPLPGSGSSGSSSSGSSAAAPPSVGPSSSSSVPSLSSLASNPAAAYISGLQVGNVIKLKRDPSDYTIIEINPNQHEGKIFRVSKPAPTGGVNVEFLVSPQDIRVPPLGGKSRRFKKTKRRRQKKSRKNKNKLL
jgi:hypothetical protein